MNDATMNEVEMVMKKPNTLLPDFSTVYHIVDQAVRSHHNQWNIFRAIQEHIDGKKPIDPAKIKKLGLAWASNSNFGKARFQIEKEVLLLVKKIAEAMMVGMPEFRLAEDEDAKDELTRFLEDPEERGRVASMMGMCLSRALEEDGNLYDWLNGIEYNAYTFGFCPISWEDNDWVSRAEPVTRIAFRPGSTTTETDAWVLFRTEKAEDLYNTFIRISNKRARSEDGSEPPVNMYWNPEALAKTLTKLLRLNKDNNVPYENWGEVAPVYHDNPGYVVAQTSDLNIAAVYQKEMDGSLSVVYIPWGYKWTNPKEYAQGLGNVADDGNFILYRRNYPNVNWKDFLSIVRDSGFSVENDIHSMQGMGKLAVENSIRYNRIRNSLNDKASITGSPLFQAPSTQTREKFKITLSQGFAMFPAGFNLLEKQPSFDVQNQLLIINHEDREFDEMTTHYRQDATGKLSSRPTKDEVKQASEEVNSLKSAKDRIRFCDYSAILFQTLKRIDKPSKKSSSGYAAKKKFFKLVRETLPDICKDDDDVSKLIDLVDSYQIDVVNTDLQALQFALQMSETPFARNRVKRMILIAQGFSVREINNMVPVMADKFRAFDDTRVALIENDMFWNTNEVAFQESDDHITHLKIHDKKMEDTFNALRQGALDVVKVYDYVTRLYGHMLQHVDVLGQDPILKGEAEEYFDKLREHKQVIGQVSYARKKEIDRRQQEAQQNNPGISPKDAHDIRLKNEQAAAQEERNRFKTANRAETMKKEQDLKHEARMREIDLEHEEELRKIENDRERKAIS